MIERAAMLIIWLLALAFSTIPAWLVAISVPGNDRHGEYVTGGGAYTFDFYLLVLGWWAPFAIPVLVLGIIFIRVARNPDR